MNVFNFPLPRGFELGGFGIAGMVDERMSGEVAKQSLDFDLPVVV